MRFEQRFQSGSPAIDMLHKDEYWNTFVPHEHSGPCYTYNPPFDSEPGTTVNMHMVLNMSDWDPQLQIFLHNPKSFFYSTKAISKKANPIYLDAEILSQAPKYPRAVSKSMFL